MRMRRHGFTLIEMMVVVAIIGILAALTINGMSGMSKRSAPANATQDLMSQLGAARSQAMARGNDVWFIVYPKLDSSNGETGPGGYFVYLDPTGGFLANGYGDFDPASNLSPISEGRLLEKVYLDNYSGKNVVFGARSGTRVPAPYGFDLASGCSFCSNDGGIDRGAIVFRGDGTATFFDGDGTPVLTLSTGENNAGKRSQYLSLKAKELTIAYAVVVNGPTGSINLFRMD